MYSRRKFLAGAGMLAAGSLDAASSSAEEKKVLSSSETVNLCGRWGFRTDPAGEGADQRWFDAERALADRSLAEHALAGHPMADHAVNDWQSVDVPHTWQVDPAYSDYRGIAWYRRRFDVADTWRRSAVRIEFEAVFHSATVWINGQLAGEHTRKGYTAFALDITPFLRSGQSNTVAVRVDNAFDDHMLPRGHSSDWAHDGGIYRPVQLLVTPRTFLERVHVDAIPDFTTKEGRLAIAAYARSTDSKRWKGRAWFQVVDEETGLAVLNSETSDLTIEAGAMQAALLHAVLPEAKLWHFDHPHLYRLDFSIADERESHTFTTTFGVRKLEVKDGGFHLNGEHVRLMGVERMGGSNPEFGMAEPEDWIHREHADMKNLNCVFTRVHWPQDKRVHEYCDRHGILMQTEVPAWGPDTFRGMTGRPDAEIMQNGLEQLQEMMARDRNHPSIVVWGLCNEIDGQNPPAYEFAKRLLEEAKRLDPERLCSYASNSLFENAGRDVAALMDFIEANEYFGSWQQGPPEAVGKHLDSLQAAFPGKPIVISEYGYCACSEDRPEGDGHRIEILRSHDAVIRTKDFVAGAIFFCYHDYRTHVGDRGMGALKQRVHGVVDLYGRRKPSYEVLRAESGPIESLAVENTRNAFRLRVRTRRDLPMYTLRGYRLRGLLYGEGDIPVEQQEAEFPETAPGGEVKIDLKFGEPSVPLRVMFDVFRPDRFSAYSFEWEP
jgi:beta-galactosidase